jgi:hypothetical protein
MFNLIMLSAGWDTGNAKIPVGRVFEYTDDHIAEQYKQNSKVDLDKLSALPCLFMQEGIRDEIARVGQINRSRIIGAEIIFEYSFDVEVPPILNSTLYASRISLDMPHEFEFSRNHWAVKNIDLYRFLLRNTRPRRQRPIVFQIAEHESIEPALVSAMMPFDAGFSSVYDSIRLATESVEMRCRRADDIWENVAIIQDIVSLIDHSRIIVCDCTGRNPNVFYEAGIAHALGREVILITQSENDIPFDLRHLRYIKYLNNVEGRSALSVALQSRMQTILGH